MMGNGRTRVLTMSWIDEERSMRKAAEEERRKATVACQKAVLAKRAALAEAERLTRERDEWRAWAQGIAGPVPRTDAGLRMEIDGILAERERCCEATEEWRRKAHDHMRQRDEARAAARGPLGVPWRLVAEAALEEAKADTAAAVKAEAEVERLTHERDEADDRLHDALGEAERLWIDVGIQRERAEKAEAEVEALRAAVQLLIELGPD